MRKDWKYIVYVTAAIGLFVAVKLLSPKQYDWSVTLAHEDKNPYGTFALNNLLPDVIKAEVRNSYQTLYELKDSLRLGQNVVIISSSFNCGKEDTNALLAHVAKGGTAFISAQYFYGHFSDSLNLSTYDYFFSGGNTVNRSDSAYLRFASVTLDTTAEYFYRRDNIHNYFERFDTTRTTVIAKNDYQNPVTIRMAWGKGNIILNCTPLVFTNIYLLARHNHEFASTMLSYLPQQEVCWTEYYHLGRREAATPLRYILNNEHLSWAYYLVIISVLLFMLFESKRKQRVIPVIKPLGNTTLEFVATIGNLYYQNSDHKNIAEKKINYLLEQIRFKYLLRTNKFDEEFFSALSSKSGHPVEEVRLLFNMVSFISTSRAISADDLMDFNQMVERFNAGTQSRQS